MLRCSTLNLTEDKERIKEIMSEYLAKTNLLNWKYEDALQILIKQNLQLELMEHNLKILGDLYLEKAIQIYQKSNIEYSTEEKEKMESLQRCIYEICTASPIKKLVKRAQHSRTSDTSSRSQHNAQIQSNSTPQVSAHFNNMTPVNKMEYLCDKFGEQGYLDLMDIKIAKRYAPHLKELTQHFDLLLQPTATYKEREMLMKIGKCKSNTDIDNLLIDFYADKNMDSMCRYIRLAFATAAELWSSRQLLKTDHNESWYRTHVYSAVWDNAFMYDDKFDSKRADCYSSITKEFEDVKNQRIDFILRNINDDMDYFSAEEKPSRKGVKSDMRKGKLLQKYMLRKWIGHLNSGNIMKELEAITCQWEGLKLTIYATKHISNNHVITYRKGSFSMPKEETHAALFAQLLAAVLSLKRLVYINYTKLNTILEAKYAYEIEMMKFTADDEINFRSDSTADLELQEEEGRNNQIMDSELEKDILMALRNIGLEETIVTHGDWEEFIMEKVSKKRKTPTQ